MFNFLKVYKDDLKDFAKSLKDEATPLTNAVSSWWGKEKVMNEKTPKKKETKKSIKKKNDFFITKKLFLEDINDEEKEKASILKVKEFSEWITDESNDVTTESHMGKFDALLKENKEIGVFYSELVPKKLNKKLFWQRYSYRKVIFELEMEKKKELEQIAKEEEDLSWDEGEDMDEIDDDISLNSNKIVENLRKYKEIVDSFMKIKDGDKVMEFDGKGFVKFESVKRYFSDRTSKIEISDVKKEDQKENFVNEEEKVEGKNKRKKEEGEKVEKTKVEEK